MELSEKVYRRIVTRIVFAWMLILGLHCFINQVDASSCPTVGTCTVNCQTCTLSNDLGTACYTITYPSCVCEGSTFTITLTITTNDGYGASDILLVDFAPAEYCSTNSSLYPVSSGIVTPSPNYFNQQQTSITGACFQWEYTCGSSNPTVYYNANDDCSHACSAYVPTQACCYCTNVPCPINEIQNDGGFPASLKGSNGNGYWWIPAAAGGLGCSNFTYLSPNIPYSLSFQVYANASGIALWVPQKTNSGNNDPNNPGNILRTQNMFSSACSIVVIPLAELVNEQLDPVCQNTIVQGQLPAPADPGAIGSYSYVATNSQATGGLVSISSDGSYTFVPNPNFYGDAQFSYSVAPSGTSGVIPAFCTGGSVGGHTGVGTITIPYAQNPAGSNTKYGTSICGGTNLVGSLVQYVTGGSGNYTFAQNGGPSCGQVSIASDGTFSYTAPTVGGVCSFNYIATDTAAPHCTGGGTLSISNTSVPTANSQTGLGVCINTPLSGILTAINGSRPYTFSVVPGSEVGGTVTALNATTGAFTFTPTTGFTGAAGFQFTVTDTNGCVSPTPGIVTIEISNPPVANPGFFTGCEGSATFGSLTGLVSGGDAPYTFSSVGTPTNGSVFVASNGTFTFYPAPITFTGTGTFGYIVAGDGCTAVTGATVSVLINPAPIGTGSSFSMCANSTGVEGNLCDYLISPTACSSKISFSGLTGTQNGTLTLSPTGPFSYVPNYGFSGTDNFFYQILDSDYSCVSPIATANFTVYPLPTIGSGVIGACQDTPVNGNLNPVVSGKAPLSFNSITGASQGGSVNLQDNGLFLFQPNFGFLGTASFEYQVTDADGCSATGTQYIIVNARPTAQNGSALACGGVPVSGSLTGLVSGGNPCLATGQSPYTYHSVGLPLNGTVNVTPEGIYTFTPYEGVTSANFQYEAVDCNGCGGTGLINVSVNPGPQAASGLFESCANSTVNSSLTGLVSGGTPPLIFYQTGAEPTCGSVAVNFDGTFSFQPLPNFVGSCSFQYQVEDSGLPPCTSQVETVQVSFEEGPTVFPVTFNSCANTTYTGNLNNSILGGLPPYTFFETGSAPSCGSLVINPNGTFVFVPQAGFTGDCTFNYHAADSVPCYSNVTTGTVSVHPLPVAANTGPLNICKNTKATGNLNTLMSVGTPPYSFAGFNTQNGSVTINPSGIYSFNPSANYVGAAGFDFTAQDVYGCKSNTGTVSLTVNQTPTISVSPSSLTACQNSSVSGTATASGGTAPYIFSIVNQVNGTGTVNPTTGAFTFTPTAGFIGSASLTIGVTDSIGCVAQITVFITVVPSPAAQNVSVSSCQNTVFGDLTMLVSSGTPPYVFSQSGAATCGSVVINPSGPYTYTGPSGYMGPCTFGYTVTDTNNCSNNGTVTISMVATGAPTATNGSYCACFNTPVTGNLNDLVSGGLPPYTFLQVGQAVGGTVLLNTISGQFTFIPTTNFEGQASFQYVAVDSSNQYCQSNVATVIIDVPCCFGQTAVTGL